MNEQTTLTQRLATAAKESNPGSWGALISFVGTFVAAWQVFGPFVESLRAWLKTPDGRSFALFVTNWTGDHPHATVRIVVGVPLALLLIYILKFGVVPAIKAHWLRREDRPFWAEVVLGVFSPTEHATWAAAEKIAELKAPSEGKA
jgi:hypothetical protein